MLVQPQVHDAAKVDAEDEDDNERRMEEDVTAVKEVNAAEPIVFDDEEESLKKLRAEVKVSGSHCTQQDTQTVDPTEISEEDVQNMLQISPMAEFKVEALQVKYPFIDWKIYSKGSRTYWRMIRVGRVTQAYQSFEDMLKDFDREDLDALWRITKNKFSTTMPILDKEKALWAELTRYDIYMLAEKDYPLSNQVMTLMLSFRLQVEEDSEVVRDLVMKIFLKVRVEAIVLSNSIQTPYTILLRTMTSPNHPTSNIEDAFSSNFPDYTKALPGNISPNPLDNLSKYLFASLAILPFHNVQECNVVANKLPIPPQDHITLPTILTLSLVRVEAIALSNSIQTPCTILLRLCTHAIRQGRERNNKNATWPGPTNGKEGRWRYVVLWVPLVGDVRTLMKGRGSCIKAKIRESSLIGSKLVQETTDKVVLIKEKLKVAKDHQKSYVGNMRKYLEWKLVIK
nr:hypothetical protein [Tanacetum cinerariifolium]